MARPSKYKEEFPKQAYKLCLIGVTDVQLADFFEVNPDTIYEWKKVHEEFSEALKRGKAVADGEVAKSLFHRAKGYSHKNVHVSNYQGEITLTNLTKHYPPDTTACIFWLKNRQPNLWRDKRELAIDDDDRDVEDFTTDELQEIIRDGLRRQAIEDKEKSWRKAMKNKAGRPKLELNEEQVYKLASFSLTIKDMAKILQCSVSHLNNNYLDVIDQGRANLRASILRKQYEVGITDKNITMLIWMGKQHLGQADKKAVEIDDRRTAEQLTDQELASIITGNSEEVVH